MKPSAINLSIAAFSYGVMWMAPGGGGLGTPVPPGTLSSSITFWKASGCWAIIAYNYGEDWAICCMIGYRVDGSFRINCLICVKLGFAINALNKF